MTRVTDTLGNTTTYDFSGGLTAAPNDLGFALIIDHLTRSVNVTDADGNTVAQSVNFTYSNDINNNLTAVTDMSGNVVNYVYDSGNTADPYDATPYGAAYGTRYAIFGRPSSRVQDPGGLNLTTQYRYDTTFNKQLEQIDPEGKITTYALDASGNRINMVVASGTPVAATSTFVYNSRGFMTRQTDPDGRETDYVPNSFGNLQYTVVKGNVAAGEDLTPLSGASPFPSIDAAAHWIVTERVADVMDNTLQSFDGNGNETDYAYDNWNRVITTTSPAVADPLTGVVTSAVTKSFYDFNSNLVEQDDQNGNATLTTYDAFNRKTAVRQRMDSPTGELKVTRTFT